MAILNTTLVIIKTTQGHHQDHTGSSSRPHRVIRTHSVILKTAQGHQQGIDCCEAIIATQGPSHSPGNHQDHTGSSSRPHRVIIKPLRGIRTHSVILKTTQGHQQGIDCCVAIIATQGPSHSPGNRLLCSHHGYTGAFTQPRELIASHSQEIFIWSEKKKILYPLIGFHSDNAVLILHFPILLCCCTSWNFQFSFFISLKSWLSISFHLPKGFHF